MTAPTRQLLPTDQGKFLDAWVYPSGKILFGSAGEPNPTTPHSVHVCARAHYAGKYDFPSREAAEKDKRERDELFNRIGCSYRVLPSDVEVDANGET